MKLGVLLFLFLAISAFGQQVAKEKPPKGIGIKFDKFRNETFSWMKPIDHEAIVGDNWKYIVSLGLAVSWKNDNPQEKSYFFFLIPSPQSGLGEAVHRANGSRKLGYEKRPSDSLYIAEGAEIIFLLDGKKVELPRFKRGVLLDTYGEFNATITAPLTGVLLEQFSQAVSREYAIGEAQITKEIKGNFNQRAQKEFNERLKAFLAFTRGE